MNVFGQMIKARLENVANTIATLKKGFIYFRTDVDRPFIDDGSDVSEVVMRKHLKEIIKEDKAVISSGGSFKLEMIGQNPAYDSIIEVGELQVKAFEFDYESQNEVVAFVTIPETYTGDQIALTGGKIICESMSGNVLMKTKSTLIKKGEEISATNMHESTTPEIDLSTKTLPSEIIEVAPMSVTDISGMINGAQVEGGDIIVIRVQRDNENETTPATDNAKLLSYSLNLTYGV